MRLRGAAAALILVQGAGAVSAAPRDDAGDVAAAFYTAYLKARPGGVPNASARARLAPFMTRRLIGLLKTADAAETRYARATRGRSPPLVEGDVFTSLFEGANSFTSGPCAADGALMRCMIALRYGTTAQPDTVWSDELLLRREKGGWKVDDIAYGGDWDFANKGMLTDVLDGAIAESRKPLP